MKVGDLVLHPTMTWWGLGEVDGFSFATMVDRHGVEVQRTAMARVKWSCVDGSTTFSYTPVCDLVPTDLISAIGLALVNPVYRVVVRRG